MAKAESSADKKKPEKTAAKKSPANPKAAKPTAKESATESKTPEAAAHGGPEPESQSAAGPQLPASRGKVGVFGGPKDRGFKPDDKLALPTGPHFAYERIRTLNPKGFYCAMRWDYRVEHRSPEEGKRWWANKKLLVTNSNNGQSVVVRAVDYGPHESTGLDISISPGAAEAIGVEIGDEVEIAFADQKSPLGPAE